MKDKVFAANQKFKMIQPHDTVIVGFSGGADSVALLHFLYSHRIHFDITLRACHINHNLRGDEALRDANFVQNFCKHFNIPLDTFSLDINSVAVAEGLSVEHAARNERYRVFDLLSKKYNAKIATAHTLTDSMETIIFNMARGTGIKGLTGIPAKRDNIIRPLISLTRKEIEAYCVSNHLDYVTDSTNLSDDYTRNRIRHNIIPKLYEINPNADTAIEQMISVLLNADDFITQCTKTAMNELYTKNGFSTEKLCKLHSAILDNLLLTLLSEKNCTVSYTTVADLRKLIFQKSGAVQTGLNCIFIVKNGFLNSYNPNALYMEQKFNYEIPLKEGIFTLPSGQILQILLIDCKKVKFCEKSLTLDLKNLLDCDRIKDIAVIRPRKSGDCFSLPKRGVSKSLKKLFCEDKISSETRDKIPLIADADGVIWIDGYGVCTRVAADEFTTHAYLIKSCLQNKP